MLTNCSNCNKKNTNLEKFLKSNCTYLAIEIINGLIIDYVLLEISSEKIPYFIHFPTDFSKNHKPMILLDRILRYFLKNVFSNFFNYDVLNVFSMKMTHDSKYNLEKEVTFSLLELMILSLKQRLTAASICFIYQRNIP